MPIMSTRICLTNIVSGHNLEFEVNEHSEGGGFGVKNNALVHLLPVQKVEFSLSLRAKRSRSCEPKRGKLLMIIIPGDCFGKNPRNDMMIDFLHRLFRFEFARDGSIKAKALSYMRTALREAAFREQVGSQGFRINTYLR